MFSVECEKCKNAIPLGMTDCPVCAAKAAAGDTQSGMPPPPYPPPGAPHAAAPPPQPPYGAPPAQAPSTQPYGAPPPQYAPPPPQQYAAPAQPQYAAPPQQPYPPHAAQPPYGAPPQDPYAVPPPQQPYAGPPAPPAYAQPAPPYQQTYQLPQPKPPLPSWLVAIGVALIMGLILGVGYLVVLPKMRNGGASSATTPPITMESPQEQKAGGAAPAAGAKFAKYIEVVGIRIVEENKKTMVRFLLVNHSAAELTDVNGMVEIHPTQSQNMVGRVEIKVPSLAPYESREFNADLNTKLRAYEIPDWQFLRGQFVE